MAEEKHLKPKQEKFAEEFAKCGNIRQAYFAAGYKCSNAVADSSGSRLLKNELVQARLRELAEKSASEKIADIQEMQSVLTEIIRNAKTEEVIVVEGVGNGMSEARKIRKEPALKDVLGAINLLAKMQGVFDNSLTVTLEPVTITNDLLE